MTEEFNHIDLIVCSAEQDRWAGTVALVLPEGVPLGGRIGTCEVVIHHEPNESCCQVESWPATEQRLFAKVYEMKKVPFQVFGGANDGLELKP